MLYDISNPTKAPQIIFDGLNNRKPHRVPPGETLEGIELSDGVAKQLSNKRELVVKESPWRPTTQTNAPVPVIKTPMVIIGMWGIGDNLHQRAVLKQLMKRHDVWLETCHGELYHDLIEQGLKLDFRSTTLRAQSKTIQRERGLFDKFPYPPPETPKIKLWYHKSEIDKMGSIAEAMFLPFGLKETAPDFSMPVKPEWTAAARKLIDGWKPTKPLMVFRPIVLRNEWDGKARNPDPQAYRAIFEAIRERFFVVSIADLELGKEWIVGPELAADVKLHKGELDFPTLAGLWKEADLFFGNPGFGPVLAQAVGTPLIVVYGGRESYRTTERAGAHLAPTLGIDPVNPCDCHSHHHKCDKRIDIPRAVERAVAFVEEQIGEAGRAARAALRAKADAPSPPVLLNFGCGTNHLPGWRNMDIEVNIEKRLPFDDASADAVFSEHCVEHVSQYKAIEFFKDAFRILKPGGLIRITVPSLEQVIEQSEEDYWKFSAKFQTVGPTLEGAMHAIVYAHGHQTVWTASALRACLFLAGFRDLTQQKPGESDHEILRGAEGHAAVIGEKFNSIESLTFEGRKPDAVHFVHSQRTDASTGAPASLPAVAGAGAGPRADAGNRGRDEDRGIQDPRTLIFATTYVDCAARQELTDQWLRLHTALNPDFDFLLVDSNSPVSVLTDEWRARFDVEPGKFQLFDFGDNVGHLSRKGRDGWGRAFCKGLNYAVERGYEHVVHVEGDSLFRVPAAEMIRMLKASGKPVGTIPVIGTTRPVVGWVETGLMAFDVSWLRKSGFTSRYDWPNRQERPTPELVIMQMLGASVAMLPIKGMRNDCHELTYKNIVARNLDWVTHCHEDVWCYREFLQAALAGQSFSADKADAATPARVAVVVGGAANVWEEIKATEELLARVPGAWPRFFVINSMIPLFPGDCTAISLHPQSLRGWLEAREQAGHPKPDEVWAHVKHATYPDVTHSTDDWRGSSGLFSVAVARKLGYERIVLCGVPMQANAGHIIRGSAAWGAANQFIGGWKTRRAEIAPYVRSWSGVTAEMFGKPDAAFLSS